MKIKRRDMLKGMAAAGGALTLGFVIPTRAGAEKTAVNGIFEPNAFIRIDSENRVTIILGKSEMGQNVYTGLPLIVAEELDADFAKVKVVQGGVKEAFNSPMAPMMITGGSTSTYTSYDMLRVAGATARHMILAAAARAWGVAAGALTTENGVVTDPASNRQLTYGELAGAAASLDVPADVPLKDPADFRLIGKDHLRLDSEPKVTGRADFGFDTRVPGMKFAVVARSPVPGGSLASVDDKEARSMPGVLKIKAIPTGVAVIAESTWQARKARDALSLTWNEGEFSGTDSGHLKQQYIELVNQPGHVVRQQGDTANVLAGSEQVIESIFEFPFLAHACMEPLNATVLDKGSDTEIWVGTQMQTNDRRIAAQVLGCDEQDIELHTPFLGGGFGRRATIAGDFVGEAAAVAKGEPWPVQTAWMREDDMHGGYYRPMTVHRSRMALGSDGKPLAWHVSVVSQALTGGELFGMSDGNYDLSQVEGLEHQPYAIPNLQIEAHLVDSPVTTLWWRSVGNTHTAFVKETMIDQAAHAAGADPLDYRLELLGAHPRQQALLNKVKAMSGWGRELPDGSGLGVAVHDSFGSIVAQVAEVRIDSNEIHVEKVWCAVDCGFAVNPLSVEAQMESGIVFGMSAALFGEITFRDGKVQQSNFHDYPVVRMHQSPQIEVAILNSGANLGGIGEPGTPPIFPAIGNAIFAASGKRLQSLPFRLQV